MTEEKRRQGRCHARELCCESLLQDTRRKVLPLSSLAVSLSTSNATTAVELRPPRAELDATAGIEAWIDTYHAVRGLTRDDTYVFLTDGAVGQREEQNLRHLVANLGNDAPRERVVPFLTAKHSLDYCLEYADRAWEHGFTSLVVLGGDTSLGPDRCVARSWQLRQECADDLPHTMLGDGQRLRQVLTNFVGNAIKFTEQGQIVIRTTVVKESGDFRTIRFEVVDTGVGIADHLHEYVFEGFAQADNSTAHQFGGAGLGLAISKHLVELMGGQIGLVSQRQDEDVLVAVVTGERGGNLLRRGLAVWIPMVGQDLGVALAGDDVAEDREPGLPDNVADDERQLEIHLDERLLHPADVVPGGVDDDVAVAYEGAHGEDRSGGAKAATQEPDAVELAQPLTVLDIALAAGDVFDVAGVDEQHLDPPGLEDVVDRDPVDAGGFHGNTGDPTGDEPVGEALEVRGEGREGLDGEGVPIGRDRDVVLG